MEKKKKLFRIVAIVLLAITVGSVVLSTFGLTAHAMGAIYTLPEEPEIKNVSANYNNNANRYSDLWQYWSQGASQYYRMRKWGCHVVAQAKMCVEMGLVSDNENFNPDTFLLWAAERGHWPTDENNIAEQTASGTSVMDYAAQKGVTVLRGECSYNGNVDTVQQLIEAGYYVIVSCSAHQAYVGREASLDAGTPVLLDSWNSVSVNKGTLTTLYGYSLASFNTIYYFSLNGSLATNVGDSDTKSTQTTEIPTETTQEKSENTAKTFTLYFDTNGGSTTSLTEKTVTVGQSYGKLPKVKKTGYVFRCWSTGIDSVNRVFEDTLIVSDEIQTLYALWYPQSYIITFNTNNDYVECDEITVSYKEKIGPLPVPVDPTGLFIFEGWYDSDGKCVDSDTIYELLEDTTLYANWVSVEADLLVSDVYSDVFEDDWYAESVLKAYKEGILLGRGDGTFCPNDNITIAEAVTIAVRLHIGNTPLPETDVWYDAYLNYAIKNGIIDYTTAKNPTRTATRDEFAKIISTCVEGLDEIYQNVSIPDVNEEEKPYIYTLYRMGVLFGNDSNGTFTPERNITRAEIATIISRIL